MKWAYMTLKTGVPGSGKSLTIVREMQQAMAEEIPPLLFVHGIPDLVIPHVPLPVFAAVIDDKGKPVQGHSLEVDWSEVPNGSVVVIDEAQHIFPVRGAGSKVPAYVGFLNTHRHKGITIILLTQHPRLIDTAVRKLVGKHQHYRRIFGMQRHMCYEWDAVSETLAFAKAQTTKQAAFPTKAYTAYKSAEVHSKPKFAIPWVLFVPVLALGLALWTAPDLYRMAKNINAGRSISADAAAENTAPGQVVTPGAPGQSIGKLGTSAPVASAESVPPTPAPPYLGAAPGKPVAVGYVTARDTWPAAVAGCWISAGVCQCATNESPPRILASLQLLCEAVAAGKLGPDPARPAPARLDPSPTDGLLSPATGAASSPALIPRAV